MKYPQLLAISLLPVVASLTCQTLPGTYCPSPDSPSSIECPPGTYCVANATEPTPCPGGRYSDKLAATDCPNVCPGGSYCPEGSKEPIRCPAETYCPPRTATAVPCPSGNYCPEGSVSPRACPNGKTCSASSSTPIDPARTGTSSNSHATTGTSSGVYIGVGFAVGFVVLALVKLGRQGNFTKSSTVSLLPTITSVGRL